MSVANDLFVVAANETDVSPAWCFETLDINNERSAIVFRRCCWSNLLATSTRRLNLCYVHNPPGAIITSAIMMMKAAAIKAETVKVG